MLTMRELDTDDFGIITLNLDERSIIELDLFVVAAELYLLDCLNRISQN